MTNVVHKHPFSDLLLCLCELSCTAEVILEFLWTPFIWREEQFEDTGHLVFGFDDPSCFSRPGRNSTYPEAAIKCDVSFDFLSRGEKAWLCGGNVLQGSSRFHRFILSERPSRRNIYTRKHHSNTSTSLQWVHREMTGKTQPQTKNPKGAGREGYILLCCSASSIR